ncbi:MAG: hypothetical protein KDA42_02595 [Planctomycetales bacterium]|nr:hypothetical protein [Planctomycetales bacterium]
MNRLDPLTLEPTLSAAKKETYEVSASQLFIDQRDEPYSLFVPQHYEPNYKYPLVVWLHGPSDNELQLKRIMPLVSTRNYAAVGPRGTLAEDHDNGSGGYAWSQSEDHVYLAEQRVFAAIESASRRLNVEPDRIFLAGFESGGTMAVRIALSHPRRFAGAITFGGEFPRGHAPLRHLRDARRLPLLLANGLENPNYPESQVCNDLRLFYVAGLSVTLRQYPCANDLTTVMLSDMDRWIMNIVCPEPVSDDQGI